MAEERAILAAIGRILQMQEVGKTPPGRRGVEAPTERNKPIKWKTTKAKKKGIGGLISRLRDPKALTDRERMRLNIALKSDVITSGPDRTDEGALMGLRAMMPGRF